MNVTKILTLTILSISLSIAEPSVYGSSSSTSNYHRKKRPSTSRKIVQLKQQIARLKEEIEGLKTVVRGLQRRVNYLSKKSMNNSQNQTSSTELKDILYRLNMLEQKMRKREYLAKASSPKPQPIPKAEPTSPKKRIKKETPEPKPKPEPKAPSKPKPPKKVQKPKDKPTKTEPTEVKEKRLTSKELYERAKKRFSNKDYAKAGDDFRELLKKGYKKAYSYFMLGEIAYNQGRYTKAIELYQKSAEIKADTNYMDKLLLHTAISLKKSGQPEQAKEFFKTLVDAYPNSVSASTAKRYLKSMN